MKYDVRISARAERDVDQTFRWFRDQRATDTSGLGDFAAWRETRFRFQFDWHEDAIGSGHRYY